MGAITDVPGIKVGQYQNEEAATGCTVILTPQGAVASVEVRGSAPGTRETDVLDPQNLVQTIQAIVLSGGSAFGLEATQGVVNWLREHDFGFQTAEAKVPIVPAAVIYDLGVGVSDVFPDSLMGYLACTVAGTDVMEGNFGAGAGASVGKILGGAHAMKSGVGTASAKMRLLNPATKSLYECTVGALVVTNAFGDVYRDGKIIAGARGPNKSFINSAQFLRDNTVLTSAPAPKPAQNTTLAVVATDAPLTKLACQKIAQMAHDGMARAIRPVHTMFDGDTIFALSTGGLPSQPVIEPFLLTALGSVAADVLENAIIRSVTEACPFAGLPAYQS